MAITTAAEMREKRAKGVEFLLPEYGDVVFIKPMDPGLFLKSGRLPNFLVPVMNDLINKTSGSIDLIPKDLTPDQTKEWLEFLDNLAKEVIISPKVVDSPREGENEIGVDELSTHDKLRVYLMFGRPASLLRSFRQQQIADVAALDAAKNNGANAKQTLEGSTVG